MREDREALATAAPRSPLQVVSAPDQLRSLTASWRCEGETVGLVPTMGALHAGHLSLVRAAMRDCSRVVVSIFVNPLQFGPGEDFERYPRQLDADLAQLRALKVDACYCPTAELLYPPEFASRVTVDAAGERWEMRARPGHFAGVATGPCRAYFGEKDAQQAVVVSRLGRDLDLGAAVVVCPVVREPDGLALSSRNTLLSAEGRRAALCLSRAIGAARRRFAEGTVSGQALARLVAEVVSAEPDARLDYAGVVDFRDFSPVTRARDDSRVMVAATVEGVRLIDTGLLATPCASSR
jgi:pantoate--beta-alanine ligase